VARASLATLLASRFELSVSRSPDLAPAVVARFVADYNGAPHVAVYLFGAFLVVTSIRFLREEQHEPGLRRTRVLRIARRIVPVTDGYRGQKFFVREHGVRYATPLFLVLIFIEVTDLAFAIDSVPTIYATTDDPLIVFTSNIFAIFGLRALYFVVAGYLRSIALLRPALAVILVFVGGKMLASDFCKVHPGVSLAFIVSLLAVAVAG
jgi:tellurite resistance protein TerC